jgi:adenylosuccinate synthase
MTQDEWIHMAEASRSEGVGFDVMPVTIRAYIERIEHLAGVPVVSIGIGPDRRASIAKAGGPFDSPSVEATF